MKCRKRVLMTTTLAVVTFLSTSIGIVLSKGQEPVKNNVYAASQKTVISTVSSHNTLNSAVAEKAKQTEATKLAQIVADKAKQEEIDRIAIERPAMSKQAKIAGNYRTMNATAAKAELARVAAAGPNQTVIGAKLSMYLKSSTNISSVINRAVALHCGDPHNICVYFSSEAMRSIGVPVPKSVANTGLYLSYLRSHGWVTSYNIKELTAGSICFTTHGSEGYNPTHTFVFMGWVTPGNYTLAYVADSQGTSVHVRNMGVTSATEAFGLFMHIPTAPAEIHAASLGYNTNYIRFSSVAGASGYELYRATSSRGSYALILRSTAKSYYNTGLTTNNTYYYKVRAYRIAGYTKVYSNFSNTINLKSILSKPREIHAALLGYNQIYTRWSSVTGASGYELYRATTSNGFYALTLRSTAQSYYNTGLTTNRIYYYKVRAYRNVGKIRVYSNWSTVVHAKA
ncbi:fibronectin type III domain-containing protein [Clostridium psychrophilum]|uniref:fibronectin type III domain-containing protein n=1 Tax=Clostridium psychrophilum TaxID=132926 RepID=UPI001C0D79D6|nr:hypothetical protein [Clostridium psychrophilum]MBU3181007.1 hypothetical protein [Clostridium psychrophilum]